MSDTTRFIKARLAYWNPVLTRGMLWVGIAIMTDFRHSVGEISKRIAAGQTVPSLEWVDVTVGAALAGFIAARLFLDQTLSRHVEATKQQEIVSGVTGGTSQTKLTTLG